MPPAENPSSNAGTVDGASRGLTLEALTDARWHDRTGAEALHALVTDGDQGLTSGEVARRADVFGPNAMTQRRADPVWKRFLLQFHQALVYVLLAATVVAFALQEWVDGAVILAVVLVNALIGFFQEEKAGQAIEALAKMIPTRCRVLRDGAKQQIDARDLVPGDVVLLEAGDSVPADLRLLRANSMRADEAALTGESVPVKKDADQEVEADAVVADRTNLAFAGTTVTSGSGRGVVVAIGDLTETGRIAELIDTAEQFATPLTKKIAQFSRFLVAVILSLATVTFVVGLLRGEAAHDMFIVAVALAVGAIPEGLPVAVTVTLAIGVSRMAKRRAIIRKLPAVETLGSTTVICSDKTGTLTEGRMTVRRMLAGGRWYAVGGGSDQSEGAFRLLDDAGSGEDQGEAVDPADHPALLACLRTGWLCNDAVVRFGSEGFKSQGDPTEVALLVAAHKAGADLDDWDRQHPRQHEIPFASEHQYMATLHRTAESGEGYHIAKKGSLERLLPRCRNMLDAQGAPTDIDRDLVRAQAEAMAAGGLRVLAFAVRDVGPDHGDELRDEHVDDHLVFVGLQGLMDPPREEARTAVHECQQAGIRIKMITGDHAITARAIAGRIGIDGRKGEDDLLETITGTELAGIGDDELPKRADEVAVFARVAPEQKLRLVRALQHKGHIVAMTGDGVNDAPALRQADIGIAMGESGTDVARGASDMILTDDNFASIEAAVEEGRGAFHNLTKFIVWTLPTNFGEGLILLCAILIGASLPALPVQLLWVNMTTAIFLGLALVWEPREDGIMQRPPRNPARPLLTGPLILRTCLVSTLILISAFGLFLYERRILGTGIEEARTVVINMIVMAELFYLWNCRSLDKAIWKMNWLTSPLMWLGPLAMILAQLLFTYAPFMQFLFGTAAIGPEAWLRIVACGFGVLLVIELEKWIRFHGGAEVGRSLD